MHKYLGSSVGTQATSENADSSGELIRASSTIPPDFDNGPTGSTRHKISSLQNSTPPTPLFPPSSFSGELSFCLLTKAPDFL